MYSVPPLEEQAFLASFLINRGIEVELIPQ